jgi:hypothetical protein
MMVFEQWLALIGSSALAFIAVQVAGHVLRIREHRTRQEYARELSHLQERRLQALYTSVIQLDEPEIVNVEMLSDDEAAKALEGTVAQFREALGPRFGQIGNRPASVVANQGGTADPPHPGS